MLWRLRSGEEEDEPALWNEALCKLVQCSSLGLSTEEHVARFPLGGRDLQSFASILFAAIDLPLSLSKISHIR